LRLDRRLLSELLDGAGRRPDHSGRRLHSRLPAATRAGARRPDAAAGSHPERRRLHAAPRPRRDARPEGQAAGGAVSIPALKRLKERFADAVTATASAHGDEMATVDAARIHEILRFLKDDPKTSFDFLSDLTCVDYLAYPPEGREPRFEIVY